MMRSGQYKVTCSKSLGLDGGVGGGCGGNGIFAGQFRTSYGELPALSTFVPPSEPTKTEFPHLNSLFVAASKRYGRKDSKSKDGRAEMSPREKCDSTRVLRHRSCENLSLLPRSAVTHVEHKVRSLLLRGETKKRAEVPFQPRDVFESATVRSDAWLPGKIVTRRPRLSAALSHSALHTLGTTSDTASCLSTSSGYSSSNSSSYGSFKSCGSTLPRDSNSSPGSSSPVSESGNRLLFVDNPLYDITPADAARLYDSSKSYDSSLTETMSSGEYSMEEPPSISEQFQDPVTKECIEYFEKRVKSSERLRKRWSLYIFKPLNDSDLISKGDAIIDSRLNPDLTSALDSGIGVESNVLPFECQQEYAKGEFEIDSNTFNSLNFPENPRKKNELDVKIDFLRREIASLMQKDNSLFKQLLALHDSISSIKIQNAFCQSSHRPLTPTSLDSFTEEEEDDGSEDDDNDDDDDDFELEDNGKIMENVVNVEALKCITSVEELKTCQTSPIEKIEANSDAQKVNIDDEEDEGHCTDLSLTHSPSHSPSPNSTLSSNSSKGSTYSRSFYELSKCSTSGSFTRCRKSYAPTARNRKRASSVHYQKSSQLQCGTTTALVVVHTDDELSLLSSSGRPRAHTFTPLNTSTLSSSSSTHDSSTNDAQTNFITRTLSHNSTSSSGSNSLSFFLSKDRLSKTKENSKKQEIKQNRTKVSLGSCSSQTVTSTTMCGSTRSNLSHPPYREALIM